MLKVFQASTGEKVLDIEAPKGLPLENLKKMLSDEVGIMEEDQILLASDGIELKSEILIEKDDKEKFSSIFLFSRVMLDPDGQSESSGMTKESPIYSGKEYINDLKEYLTSQSQQPPLQTLQNSIKGPYFLEIMKKHEELGRRFLKPTLNHSSQCQDLYNRAMVQVQALEAAVKNLALYSGAIVEAHQSFQSVSKNDFERFQLLLKNFEMDLNVLKFIPIQNSLKQEEDNASALSDYISEEQLKKWGEKCKQEHDQLIQRANKISADIENVENLTEMERNYASNIKSGNSKQSLKTLHSVILDVKQCSNDINATYQILEKDVSRVSAIVEELSDGPQGYISISRSEDKLFIIEDLIKVHRKSYLPDMAKLDKYIREALLYISECKGRLQDQLADRLNSIVKIQSDLVIIAPSLSKLSEDFLAHSEAMSQILYVHRMPAAWGATLFEGYRRQEMEKLLKKKFVELQEFAIKINTLEKKKRESFENEIVPYIPVKLKGFESLPISIEIKLSKSDDSAVKIGASDIEDFKKLVETLTSKVMNLPFSKNDNKEYLTIAVQQQSSIAKLKATLMKMSEQVNTMETEFNALLLESINSTGIQDSQAVNHRPKSKYISYDSSGTTSNVKREKSEGEDRQSKKSLEKAEATIRSYEQRIRNLEHLLEESYRHQTTTIHQDDSPIVMSQADKNDTYFYGKQTTPKDSRAISEESSVNQEILDEMASNISVLSDFNNSREGDNGSHQHELNTPINSIQGHDKSSDKELEYLSQSLAIEKKKVKELEEEVIMLRMKKLDADEMVENSKKKIQQEISLMDIAKENLSAEIQILRKEEKDIKERLQKLRLEANRQTESNAVNNSSNLPPSLFIADHILCSEKLGLLSKELEENKAILEKAVEAMISFLTEFYSLLKNHGIFDMESPEINKETVSNFFQHSQTQVSFLIPLKRLLVDHSEKMERLKQERNEVEHLYNELVREKVITKGKLEEWEIVTKLACEQLQVYYQSFLTETWFSKENEVEAFSPEVLEEIQEKAGIMSMGNSIEKSEELVSPLKSTYQKVIELADAHFIVELVYHKLGKLESKNQEYKEKGAALEAELGKRISFQNFQVGSVCLFTPTRHPKAWAAFNVNCPHYFLRAGVFVDNEDPESGKVRQLMKTSKWILARIVEIDGKVVQRRESKFNPFSLSDQVKYYLVKVVAMDV